ncbi:MAG: hypothetical protein EHM20_00165 [Alphaproteobacteria bacterium]|nr:MAG: hypothetical protein EHM20_00165 [Alphaproteobacteria bacterium]
MVIHLELNDKDLENLNSQEVKYFLGVIDKDNIKTTEDVTMRVTNIIKKVWELADAKNQLDHLEYGGVDNWSNYSQYDPYEDYDDDD